MWSASYTMCRTSCLKEHIHDWELGYTGCRMSHMLDKLQPVHSFLDRCCTQFFKVLMLLKYITIQWVKISLCSALSPQCNILAAANVTWDRGKNFLEQMLKPRWQQQHWHGQQQQQHQFASQQQQWLLLVISAQMLGARLIACSNIWLCTHIAYARSMLNICQDSCSFPFYF